VLSLGFVGSVGADHNLTRTDGLFDASPDHLQVLVTGDSHGRNAIGARQLGPDSVSIAMGGGTISKIHYRLQNLLDRGKTVDVVILSADDHVFLHHSTDQFHPIAVWGRHVNYLELATVFDEPKTMVVNAFKTRLMPYADELPIGLSWIRGNRAHFRNEVLGGNMDRWSRRQQAADSLDRYDKVFGGGEAVVDPVKRALYDRTIEDLHSRGIQVVLVRFPLMGVHNKHLIARGVREAAQAQVDEIMADERIVLLDFHELYHDRPELFHDVDHLNVGGRQKFSVLLRDVLQARGLIAAGG
jgi:hypothetical protein